MLILKRKMCGGDIQAAESRHYDTCGHCGGTVMLPSVSDERRANLFKLYR